MGWDKNGRYYTRSKRVNGRVVREYIGGGRAGELVAQMDAIDREKRETARQCTRLEREEIAQLDAPLEELNELADRLDRAALLAAGYVQHSRGEWRKKRG
jgi:hypothetical protein